MYTCMCSKFTEEDQTIITEQTPYVHMIITCIFILHETWRTDHNHCYLCKSIYQQNINAMQTVTIGLSINLNTSIIKT